MKKCLFCGADIAADAAFCGHCGNSQVTADAEMFAQSSPEPLQEPEHVAPAPPQAPEYVPPAAYPPPGYGAPQAPPQYPPAGYYPPQGAPGYAPPPQEPTALALAAKNYFPWLKKGLLGTKEPIHFLFAAIVPLVITFFFTLGTASQMGWHAGAFFLTGFFNVLYIAALPLAVWLIKKFMEKDESATPDSVFAEYSSYHNIALPIVFVAMILGIIVPVFTFGTHIIAVMFQFVRLLSLGAALTCLSPSRDDSKAWLKVVILIFVYIAMWYIVGAIYTVGMNWGWRIRW